MSDTIERSQTHSTFVIERSIEAPVPRVWRALSDTGERDQWFGGGDQFDASDKSHDFRVGGITVEGGQWHGGPTSQFHATYTDIIDRVRMVFTYDMWIDGRHISTSLTTIALESEGDGTRLTYTEQGVHFDGLDSTEGREEGSKGLMDQLANFVTQAG